jgi:hypothetical protein
MVLLLRLACTDESDQVRFHFSIDDALFWSLWLGLTIERFIQSLLVKAFPDSPNGRESHLKCLLDLLI